MALNIKNAEVERLATEVARLAGESKTEAIRKALEERKAQLTAAEPGLARARELKEFFEKEIWPHIPPELRGKRITKQEREEILGIGPHGYPE
jgi:antitoxin VapB